MITEIKTEIVSHPVLGDLTKKFIYTKDENGNIINKEFYVPEYKVRKLIDTLKEATPEEIIEIKKILS